MLLWNGGMRGLTGSALEPCRPAPMVAIAIVTDIELQEAVGILLGTRCETISNASRTMTDEHILAAYTC